MQYVLKKKTHEEELTETKIESIKKFTDIKHFYDGQIYVSNLLNVPIYIEKVYSNNKRDIIRSLVLMDNNYNNNGNQ